MKGEKRKIRFNIEDTENWRKICSGCGEQHEDVERYMHNGMCGGCIEKAAKNIIFYTDAKRMNRKIILRFSI